MNYKKIVRLLRLFPHNIKEQRKKPAFASGALETPLFSADDSPKRNSDIDIVTYEASALQMSMDMETIKRMKESEDEQTMIKGKSKEVDPFVFLPNDVFSHILRRFPDDFLRYKAKHVCKRWFNTISNMILLDHASFILQNVETFTPRLVDVRKEGEEEGFQVKVQNPDIPDTGMIRSWCNEFLLISVCKERKRFLYVYNLMTKQGFDLPECNSYCGGHYTSKCGVALSFDGYKGIYKVVHLFMGRTIECQILILTSNANHVITGASSNWKKIEFPYKNEGQHIYGDPVSVQGRYMNWRIHFSNHLVSVDMVKEEICIINLPRSRDCGEFFCSLFVMGGYLAYFDGVSQDRVEIWLLKDFYNVRWEKLQTITGNNKYFDKYPATIITYRICGMVKKRYIILKSMVDMYSYDLKFGVMKKIDIEGLYTQFDCDDEHCVFHITAPSLK